jgi:hypothetical protein
VGSSKRGTDGSKTAAPRRKLERRKILWDRVYHPSRIDPPGCTTPGHSTIEARFNLNSDIFPIPSLCFRLLVNYLLNIWDKLGLLLLLSFMAVTQRDLAGSGDYARWYNTFSSIVNAARRVELIHQVANGHDSWRQTPFQSTTIFSKDHYASKDYYMNLQFMPRTVHLFYHARSMKFYSNIALTQVGPPLWCVISLLVA